MTVIKLKLLPLLPVIALMAAVVLGPALGPGLTGSVTLQMFKTSFIGLLLEALPFVLVGALLSSLLQVFVSDETIARFLPRNPVAAIAVSCLLGLIFPVCECGMIPLVRRLIQKGMPVHSAVVFILAGPVLNPLVFGATLTAFAGHPEFAYARMLLAFAVAFLTGLALWMTVRQSPLRLSFTSRRQAGVVHRLRGGRMASLFVHASDDFFEMGKYLLAGCLLTSAVQTFIAREALLAAGGQPLGSYLFMMGFAFVLSLCSTSDAFIAATFTHTFPAGSLLAFMVLGPMLDFKNALMLLALFKTRFALFLFFLIFALVFLGAVLSSLWLH